MQTDEKGDWYHSQQQLSPRSVALSNNEYSQDDCTSSGDKLEMANYVVEIVLDILGYPLATGLSLVSKNWNRQFQRIYRNEILELKSVLHGISTYLVLPENTKSTISVSFSSDKQRFASTHGDHTVKVINFSSGDIEATLRGHPRTPWTVKFHPHDPQILASGCLGFEARIWHLGCDNSSQCTARAEFDRAIISLSFHPDGDLLAVAAGNSIYIWHYGSGAPPLLEFHHPHPIRCLRFLPNGSLVVGAANSVPTTVLATGPLIVGQQGGQQPPIGITHQRSQHQRATFQLVLCQVDAQIARDAARDAILARGPGRRPLTGTGKVIIRPRCILRQALFYNDGGFDVSPCGTFLCSCAELWLPANTEEEEERGITPRTARAQHRSLRRRNTEEQRSARSPSDSPLDSDASLSNDDRDDDNARRRRRFALDEIDRSMTLRTPPRLPKLPAVKKLPALKKVRPRVAPSSALEQGRYQPHLVIVSLIHIEDNEGRILQAAPLDDRSFSGAGYETAGSDIVTSVKLSPTANFVLLGHSRGGDVSSGDGVPRIVSIVYRVGDMTKLDTRKQIGDDVNIARFHPTSGAGLIYGTKQGRICKLVADATDGDNNNVNPPQSSS
uniref:F-box domain-containing protein n=1 Tax=Aureoumbra lagunensis TaxID=44058 RepID=A0A7S3JR96_9STRA|mmetsp:Transcript_22820/g.29568  ORF Transcript_22820/g.29568 Transcript_22820/m.29568 type:complete len:613 (+) Transcript_22820:29-1867(+)